MTEIREVDGRQFTVRNLDAEALTPKEHELAIKIAKNKGLDEASNKEAAIIRGDVDVYDLEEALKELKEQRESGDDSKTPEQFRVEIANIEARIAELLENERQVQRPYRESDGLSWFSKSQAAEENRPKEEAYLDK